MDAHMRSWGKTRFLLNSPLMPHWFSRAPSFITLFLTLVYVACTNSCHHPAGVNASATSQPFFLPLTLYFLTLLTLLFSLVSFTHLAPLSVCLSSRISLLSCLIYIIPCIFFNSVHFSSTSNLPGANLLFFFSLHVCDLWWSPPLIALLLISSAHGPVFCCRPNSGQNRT